MLCIQMQFFFGVAIAAGNKYVNINSPTTDAVSAENNENISIKIKIKINSEKKRKIQTENGNKNPEKSFHRTLSIFISLCFCKGAAVGSGGLSNRLSRLCHRPCHCQPVFCRVVFGLPRCATYSHSILDTKRNRPNFVA